MKWVAWYGSVHAVLLDDGTDVLTWCNVEIAGEQCFIEPTELFPPNSCLLCRRLLAAEMAVEEPIDAIVARGFQPFDSTQS